ncbi:MAG: hypothetical protein EPN35_14965 [Rhodanobacter sp.]|uniref:hypothetical protein n=1 Tax=Rhodanobacter TaxID=75309 RepID=UPI000ACCD35C|nr:MULTISPECIES: hypothetical protein [Rhodanobacter]TAN14617.1 MAG: hypothetical protein EPN35_14965 [Rhodanobacter sp.]UJJ55227.1 hypothetical protein LRK53_02145 [Rhodanobacter thiooxydans]
MSTPGRLAFSMEHNMPFVEYTPSAVEPFHSTKAAFEAAGVPDPNAEISFKDGCTGMGFYRQNFQIALKRQQHMDAVDKIVTRLPKPHWKGGSQWFFRHEIAAYTAATHSE